MPGDESSAEFRLEQLLATRAKHASDLQIAERDDDAKKIGEARLGLRR